MPAELIALALFLLGAILAIWATERLLEGLVLLARLTALSTFAIGAALSGFEAENIAIGVIAAFRGSAPIALGTVFGGAIFLICVALGLGAVLYPVRVHLPPGFLIVLALTPLLPGLEIFGSSTNRLVGVILLLAFAVAMAYLIAASRTHSLLENEEIREALSEKAEWPEAVGKTIFGLVAIGIGGELVASGAQRVVATLGIPVLLMGMVVTPAVIELEEIVRQAIPSREGHPEISAGNLVGTLLYFLLFNLGLIALAAPVVIPAEIRTLDWPFLVGATWLATLFLARGKVGRVEGALLLMVYVVYAILHL